MFGLLRFPVACEDVPDDEEEEDDEVKYEKRFMNDESEPRLEATGLDMGSDLERPCSSGELGAAGTGLLAAGGMGQIRTIPSPPPETTYCSHTRTLLTLALFPVKVCAKLTLGPDTRQRRMVRSSLPEASMEPQECIQVTTPV